MVATEPAGRFRLSKKIEKSKREQPVRNLRNTEREMLKIQGIVERGIGA